MKYFLIVGCAMKYSECLFRSITEDCSALLNDPSFKEQYRYSKRHFTRNRKMHFADFMTIIISNAKNTLQGVLNQFLLLTKQEHKITYSKQAFSKGRLRIRPEAFKALLNNVVRKVYATAETQTWNGYHVIAIDGSRLNLPSDHALLEEFGARKTGGAPQPQALLSCLYDVLNGFVIDAKLDGCQGSERDQAAEMIRSLDTALLRNPLFLADRGCPSSALPELLDSMGMKYLIRCDRTFLSRVPRKGNDTVVRYKFARSDRALQFRIITCELPSGEKEYLITNLFGRKFRIGDFAYLYSLRRGIESRYNDLKNKLQIENFTGTSPIAVRQDVLAALFLADLSAVLVLDHAGEFKAAHNKTNNMYTYKMNINLTFSILRQRLVVLLLSGSERQRKRIICSISRFLLSASVPIRSGRSFDRSVSHKMSKFPLNCKLP